MEKLREHFIFWLKNIHCSRKLPKNGRFWAIFGYFGPFCPFWSLFWRNLAKIWQQYLFHCTVNRIFIQICSNSEDFLVKVLKICTNHKVDLFISLKLTRPTTFGHDSHSFFGTLVIAQLTVL